MAVEILLGDCTKLMSDIPDNSVDLLITDPPYAMEFVSNHRRVKHDPIANDDNLEFLEPWLAHVKRTLKPDGHGYIFCSHHNIDVFVSAVKRAGLPYKNLLVWKKNNTGMGDLEGDYAPQYELIIFISNGNKKLNYGRHPNILEFDRTMNDHHPTEKPVDLIRFLILKSSQPGDLVMDNFVGSGPTPLACVEEKRDFIGHELERKHYRTAKMRLKIQSEQPKLF